MVAVVCRRDKDEDGEEDTRNRKGKESNGMHVYRMRAFGMGTTFREAGGALACVPRSLRGRLRDSARRCIVTSLGRRSTTGTVRTDFMSMVVHLVTRRSVQFSGLPRSHSKLTQFPSN